MPTLIYNWDIEMNKNKQMNNDKPHKYLTEHKNFKKSIHISRYYNRSPEEAKRILDIVLI